MTYYCLFGFFTNIFPEYNIQFQNLVSIWIVVMASVALMCFVISEITRNYSQVDKLWSLLPIAYGWITVATIPSPRLIFMTSLVTIWGLRLSYNFYRKGGYNIIPWKGKEDYRWNVMRNKPFLKGRLRFGLFNLLFVSLYQNILILLLSTPMLLAALHPEKQLTVLDFIAGVIMLAFITTEGIADNQLFRFHREKLKSENETSRYKESLKRGFFIEGLWKYSRHPNFTCEQACWISFYFFGIAASGQWFNFTLAGPVLLILLFLGSSQLTESISSEKYREYSVYQKEIPKFIPRFFTFKK